MQDKPDIFDGFAFGGKFFLLGLDGSSTLIIVAFVNIV